MLNYPDLKHEAIAECSWSDKARIARFLNVFWNEPRNTIIREGRMEIYVF